MPDGRPAVNPYGRGYDRLDDLQMLGVEMLVQAPMCLPLAYYWAGHVIRTCRMDHLPNRSAQHRAGMCHVRLMSDQAAGRVVIVDCSHGKHGVILPFHVCSGNVTLG